MVAFRGEVKVVYPDIGRLLHGNCVSGIGEYFADCQITDDYVLRLENP